MQVEDKPKQQLLAELRALRKQLAESEKERMECKQVEESLREGRALLSAILEQLPLAVGVHNRDGEFILCNSAMRYYVPGKIPSHDTERKGRWQAFDADGRSLPPEQWPGARALRGEIVTPGIECRYTAEDSREVWALVSAVPYRSAKGESEGVIVVIQDISDRRQLEEVMQDLGQRLTHHLRHSPLAVIEWGPDMQIIRWSDMAQRIFGWHADEVIGKRMEDFRWIFDQDKDRVVQVASDSESGENPHHFSAIRCYRKDGSLLDCEWYNSSLLDESGNLRSILSLVLDVTERKLLQDELSQFAYVASHDLKAPLRAIHNYTDFLREDLEETLDSEPREYLDGLTQAVRQGETLIDDLLAFSRIERVKQSIEQIDLGAFVKEIQSELEATEEVEISVVENWPVIEGDKSLLTQVLSNLLGNAIKFNKSDEKRVELGWRSLEDNFIELSVRDNGIGIDPPIMNRYSEFFSGCTTEKNLRGPA